MKAVKAKSKKAKATRKLQSKGNGKESTHERLTVGNKITKLFAKNKKHLTTRDVWNSLNRGKKPAQQASIANVRTAVRNLLAVKQLKVVKHEGRMFVLARRDK